MQKGVQKGVQEYTRQHRKYKSTKVQESGVRSIRQEYKRTRVKSQGVRSTGILEYSSTGVQE